MAFARIVRRKIAELFVQPTQQKMLDIRTIPRPLGMKCQSRYLKCKKGIWILFVFNHWHKNWHQQTQNGIYIFEMAQYLSVSMHCIIVCSKYFKKSLEIYDSLNLYVAIFPAAIESISLHFSFSMSAIDFFSLCFILWMCSMPLVWL